VCFSVKLNFTIGDWWFVKWLYLLLWSVWKCRAHSFCDWSMPRKYAHCITWNDEDLLLKCCTKMPCPLPHNHLLLAFLTCVLASPAHLYMPHLFTHCLPTIICVMLMSISFFFCFFMFLIYAAFLCDSILDCLCIDLLLPLLVYVLLFCYAMVAALISASQP